MQSHLGLGVCSEVVSGGRKTTFTFRCDINAIWVAGSVVEDEDDFEDYVPGCEVPLDSMYKAVVKSVHEVGCGDPCHLVHL